VADSKQFGNPKVLQFGDRAAKPGDGHCAECEAMLADALDGTLSAADQKLFDAHMAECGPCSQLLADTRRGAAFLEMLRTPAPEPPAALLERILVQTSGQTSGIQQVGFPIPAPQPGHVGVGNYGVAAFAPGEAIAGAAYGSVLPFPRRFAAALRTNSIGQLMLQPRLAMTAAMAFFSITLTMNLTGVHLEDLRASDLKPSSLKRDITSANASVVRYYEGLRVVYELESRVHDLESAQDNDAVPPGASNPSQPANSDPAPSVQPGATQEPGKQKTAPAPGGSGQPARKQVAPNQGTSRREELRQDRRMLVAKGSGNMGYAVPARGERKLV
jgi:hypothetical protein